MKSDIGKQLQHIADNWKLLNACHRTIWRLDDEYGTSEEGIGFYHMQGREVKFTKRKHKRDERQNNLV